MLAGAMVAVALCTVGCGGSSEPTVQNMPALSAGTYRLSTVNNSALPYRDASTGATWTSGQCVIRADGSYAATFAVTTSGGTPATVTDAGYLSPIDATSALILHGDGTRTTGTLTPTGFSALLGTLLLGFTKQ